MFFFPEIYEKVEGGGDKGVHLRFFRNVFFHCGEAREGKGVMFFTKSLWDRGKGAPRERVQVDFFSSFFYC
jgi:hypothetical protein